jgi:predicted metal-dependent hydrolase
MEKIIVLNGESVAYTLTRKRVKNINLRIGCGGAVSVSAPSSVPFSEVEGFIKSKADFVLRALEAAKRREAKQLSQSRLAEGESVTVFAEKYVLRIKKSARNLVETAGDELILHLKNPEDEKIGLRVLKKFLDKQVEKQLTALCFAAYPYFEEKGVRLPEIRFRNMKSRWGSCMPKKGILTFSYRLIEAPLEFSKYVVAHEFTHFLRADHSKFFYAELSRFMPDWKAKKRMQL